jgi:4-amino-4-deoxy-L-arabinose transferase-like glycosyltransferase
LFLASVLRLVAGVPQRVTPAYLEHATRAVYLAQACVLAATAAVLFLWLARVVRRRVALVAAVAFGANPYCVVLAGLLHYDVVHLFLLISGCAVLSHALEADEPRWGSAVAAGVCWGLATLVRPTTLLLPGFVLVALLLRYRGSRRFGALGCGMAFGAALLLTIAPWTARNHAVSGRLVPVNAQGWAAIWGSTVKPTGIHPNHYNWYQLGREMTAVFSRVTGQPRYDYFYYLEFNLPLEDAYRQEALANIRRAPSVYLQNVGASFVSFNFCMNSVLLNAFRRLQLTEGRADPRWFERGSGHELDVGGLAGAFTAYTAILTVLAVLGAWSAWRRRFLPALAPGVVYACLSLAHSIVYVDLLYYYQRVPFLFVFGSYLVDAAWRDAAGSTRSQLAPRALEWVLLSGVVLAPFLFV